jgi:hypothetical protein
MQLDNEYGGSFYPIRVRRKQVRFKTFDVNFYYEKFRIAKLFKQLVDGYYLYITC